MGAHLLKSSKKAKLPRNSPVPYQVGVREVLNSLRRIVRTLRVASRTAEQRVGLSGAQLFVLQCLARQSPCSVNELAARTATDQSSVSVVVSRLVAAGHVRRTSSKLDRRKVELTLTRSGRLLLETAPEAAQDRLLSALTQLPKADLHALSRILSRVVETAEVAHETPALFFEDVPAVVKARGPARNA
jgi:DNA-binding MarR family transcriptional regulator